jgi:hypothetical protein
MKKGISISLVLLMTAAMLHLSVATHYCGGKIAASKISLTGKLANCGMESPEGQLPFHGITFSKHCCDNVVIYLVIGNNYVPSFSTPEYSFNHKFQISNIPAVYPVHSVAVPNFMYANVSPPGLTMSTYVDLSDICVLRI